MAPATVEGTYGCAMAHHDQPTIEKLLREYRYVAEDFQREHLDATELVFATLSGITEPRKWLSNGWFVLLMAVVVLVFSPIGKQGENESYPGPHWRAYFDVYVGFVVPLVVTFFAAERDSIARDEYRRVVRQLMAYAIWCTDRGALAAPDWPRDKVRWRSRKRERYLSLFFWSLGVVASVCVIALVSAWLATGDWERPVVMVVLGGLALAGAVLLAFGPIWLCRIAWRCERGEFDTAPGTYCMACAISGLLLVIPLLVIGLRTSAWLGAGILSGVWAVSYALWITVTIVVERVGPD